MGGVRKRVHYRRTVCCGVKITGNGNSTETAKADWERKLDNHVKRCKKCKHSLDPSPGKSVITEGKVGT